MLHSTQRGKKLCTEVKVCTSMQEEGWTGNTLMHEYSSRKLHSSARRGIERAEAASFPCMRTVHISRRPYCSCAQLRVSSFN
jgi:hypothetical protein